jgi:hypothetical protein
MLQPLQQFMHSLGSPDLEVAAADVFNPTSFDRQQSTTAAFAMAAALTADPVKFTHTVCTPCAYRLYAGHRDQ